jgi:hypothetical protein
LEDGAAALELLEDGAAALELLEDGAAALELLEDGAAALELLEDGAFVCCADARCENCIPTIVKEVRSIAEIAIAESVVTFTYVFLCIRPESLGMKFICFLPLLKNYTKRNILDLNLDIFTKYGDQPTVLYSFVTASIWHSWPLCSLSSIAASSFEIGNRPSSR